MNGPIADLGDLRATSRRRWLRMGLTVVSGLGAERLLVAESAAHGFGRRQRRHLFSRRRCVPVQPVVCAPAMAPAPAPAAYAAVAAPRANCYMCPYKLAGSGSGVYQYRMQLCPSMYDVAVRPYPSPLSVLGCANCSAANCPGCLPPPGGGPIPPPPAKGMPTAQYPAQGVAAARAASNAAGNDPSSLINHGLTKLEASFEFKPADSTVQASAPMIHAIKLGEHLCKIALVKLTLASPGGVGLAGIGVELSGEPGDAKVLPHDCATAGCESKNFHKIVRSSVDATDVVVYQLLTQHGS